MIRIAIAILNWNGKEFLNRFLPSVIKFSNFNGVRIFVIDNGSTDDSVKFLQENFKEVKIVKLDNNYGFAEGYNKGLEKINSDYYLILNSDVEVTENWLQPLIEIIDADDKIAACMPKILALNNKNYFEYAGAAGGFIDKYGYPFCQGRIFAEIEEDKNQYNSVKSIFWATGACILIKSKYFKQAGGFDGDFFAHMEEIDLCWRLKSMGYKIIYQPNSEVYHLGGGTLAKTNPRKTYLNFRNNLFLLYKNLPSQKFILVFIIRVLLDFMAILLFLSEFKFKDAFTIPKAYIGFLLSIKLLNKKKNLYKNKIEKQKHNEIYTKSIVFQYYAKKKRRFADLDL